MHLAHASRSPGSLCAVGVGRGLRTPVFALLACFAFAVIGAMSGSARAEVGRGECAITTAIGVDSTSASSSRMLSNGRALAQTFEPTDSLIRSITIWTPVFVRNSSSRLHLWITEVSAEGRPDLAQVIADGGRLADLGQDPARARYQAQFVPPISLPRRSRYAVVVVAENCGVLGVLTSHRPPSGVGTLWETSVRGCSSSAGAVRSRISGESLVFRVEFCDVGTVAQGRTWGEIKTLYR